MKFSALNQGFIFTQNGYIDLEPKHVQVGDQICAFQGCRVLFVLRKVEGHRVLVGNSFLLGYIDGEALLAVEEGRKTVDAFEIH